MKDSVKRIKRQTTDCNKGSANHTSKNELISRMYKEFSKGRAPWLTPVIPVLWEAKVGRSPEVGSSRPA